MAVGRNCHGFDWHCNWSIDGCKARQGSLHGIDIGLGWAVHPAPLVWFSRASHGSLKFIRDRNLAHQLILQLPISNTMLPIALPTLYLWLVDTLALKRGTWVIESGTKVGLHLWDGLEIEYGIKFQACQSADDVAEKLSFSSLPTSSSSLGSSPSIMHWPSFTRSPRCFLQCPCILLQYF